MVREVARKALSGMMMLLLLLAATGVLVWQMVRAGMASNEAALLWIAPLLVAVLVSFGGLFIVNPNEAKALVLFGKYAGTVKSDGFWWVNPFMVKKTVSLRVRNFETSKLKVNDNHSNPIEIAAVVVWRVVETAEALFEVDNYEHYVTVQSESGVRSMASRYPYDAHTAGEIALSSNPAEVSHNLLTELQERLGKAGVEVIEARITHLAYAPEIASAMLQRQQAGAIIAARTRIVEGAVSMVEMALEQLSARKVVDLDPERRAVMVSNLLVVLCGERGTQPIVNAGSIY